VIVRHTTEDSWASILFTELPRVVAFSVSTDSSSENTENLGTPLQLHTPFELFDYVARLPL
jgi:hypothetical protein